MAPIRPDEQQQFYDMTSPPKRLGRGRHAIVFECHGPTGRIYALKTFKQDSRSRITREIEVLQHLKGGPNIIDIIDAVQGSDGANVGIVLEYIDMEDFRSLWLRFQDMEVRYYAHELLKALDWTHSQGVIHRDLRPHNVIFDPETKKLRLIGWSSAKFYEPGVDMTVCVGLFKPPELLLGYERYDYSIDMWYFGAILVSMVFRKEPFFHGTCLGDQLNKIARVLGTDKLYRFVNEYNDIELDDHLEIGQHPGMPWTDFITPDNEHLVSDDALSLIDQVLRFDPKVNES
ncbi:putative protein kinase ck2 catalytic subunit ck2 alpha-3 [Fusarium austroafricanum]|uniref:EKC/KEOPS complex subunit BUD32 n=1 Tax=Fusarium austroafricanum TaxID=2364996 RepID=A0A8H4KQC1_9HYPO|nr:putative protein kinase ck2 catalytic subunit ck2 alpha-3 [Fusarium austroafricanum]